MKFTAKPGEQWVIRREAYRLVKEALAEKGIEFAHREVFVRLPSDLEKHLVQQSDTSAGEDALKVLPQVAAAAAIASEQTEEALSKHKNVDMDEP